MRYSCWQVEDELLELAEVNSKNDNSTHANAYIQPRTNSGASSASADLLVDVDVWLEWLLKHYNSSRHGLENE